MQEILNNALQAMPNQFTSDEYIKKAKQLGLQSNLILSGVARQFLLLNCTQLTSGRSWSKKVVNAQPNLFELTEETCIRFLKEKGYKVMGFREI